MPGFPHIGLLMDMTDEDWDKVLSSNLSSVFYCCRAAIPPMLSHGSGRIINISSMWGVNGASCEAAYSASKAGVGGLTQALAKELARSKIPVNALACGVIDTEMNKQLDEAERAELAEDIPAGRFATPEEVAEMVWKLICAPEYLTGQIITFDGGTYKEKDARLQNLILQSCIFLFINFLFMVSDPFHLPVSVSHHSYI